MSKPAIVNCPTCQQEVTWSSASEFRPFCCKRCQLIDLGEWANESHRIPAAPSDPEEFQSEEILSGNSSEHDLFK